jgi:hypothetical protein
LTSVRSDTVAVPLSAKCPEAPASRIVDPDPDIVLSCSHTNELDTRTVPAPASVPLLITKPDSVIVPFVTVKVSLTISNVAFWLSTLSTLTLAERLSRRPDLALDRQRPPRALRGENPPVLPESPQYRQWRDARRLAGQEIERFRACARDGLRVALGSLDTDTAGSDAWFELGERVACALRRLGQATYCLHEWAEPTDERADTDDLRAPSDQRPASAERRHVRARRRGRRNVRLWGTRARGNKTDASRTVAQSPVRPACERSVRSP